MLLGDIPGTRGDLPAGTVIQQLNARELVRGVGDEGESIKSAVKKTLKYPNLGILFVHLLCICVVGEGCWGWG